MKFVVVDPKYRQVTTVEYPSLDEALRAAGLSPGGVDYGMLSRRIGYVVAEFGLYVPVKQQHYCGIAGTLIAGSTVLYGVGEEGETVDLMRSTAPDVTFFLGVHDVENAIYAGAVKRPVIAVGNAVLWQWPDAPPGGMVRP